MLLQSSNKTEADVLPLPFFDIESIRILMGPREPVTIPGKVAASGLKLTNHEDSARERTWIKLEEMLVQEVSGSPPIVFKPAVTLYTAENLFNVGVTGIVNEPVQVSITVYNPLKIGLNLKNIYLLWEFKTKDDTYSNKDFNRHHIKNHIIKTATLQPASLQELILAVTPVSIGILKLKGVCYSLIGCSSQSDTMKVKGLQLFDFKTLLKSENGLSIKILPQAPCLQVHFSEIYSDVLCNEIQKVTVDLKNVSTVPLRNVYLATSYPDLISACEIEGEKYFDYVQIESISTNKKQARKNHIIPVVMPEEQLDSCKSCTFNLWLKAPGSKGPGIIDLLIYYENVDSNSVPHYRLVRQLWKLNVQESVSIAIVRQKSSMSATAEKLALSLKVTNLNKIFNTVLTEISLLKVALLSSYWMLWNEMLVPKKLTLNSEETIHSVIKLKRKIQKEVVYSAIPFSSDCNIQDRAGLAYLDFAERSTQFRVNVFEDTEQGVEKSCAVSEAVLIIQWRALVDDAGNKRTAYGQSQIAMDEFRYEIEEKCDCNVNFSYDDSKMIELDGEKNKEKPETKKLQKQITYNLLHPARVSHDFSERKMCIVPVKLMLHSVVGDSHLAVTINTLGSSG